MIVLAVEMLFNIEVDHYNQLTGIGLPLLCELLVTYIYIFGKYTATKEEKPTPAK
jgi:hypothetical protein